MLGLYPPRQTPREYSQVTLYKEIGLWVAAVQEVAANLPAPDDSAANKYLYEYHREGLTELALLLIDYTRQQRHPYYSIFQRSQGTLKAADDTIARARQCAKVFDAYSRSPKKYSRVDATIELRYLLAQLTNLLAWFQSST